jgi:hypothetical protein
MCTDNAQWKSIKIGAIRKQKSPLNDQEAVSGMFHNYGNTSDTRNSPFQKRKALLPLVKGAGGIFSGAQEMLP